MMATERGGWKCSPAIILQITQIRITAEARTQAHSVRGGRAEPFQVRK